METEVVMPIAVDSLSEIVYFPEGGSRSVMSFWALGLSKLMRLFVTMKLFYKIVWISITVSPLHADRSLVASEIAVIFHDSLTFSQGSAQGSSKQ